MGVEDFEPYLSPSYFSPYYFSMLDSLGIAAGDPPSGAAGATYRDSDAFKAIVRALSESGEFADVIMCVNGSNGLQAADRSPLAIISPETWIETDDVDPVVEVRQVSFSLTIIVRNEDAVVRYEALDRLLVHCSRLD